MVLKVFEISKSIILWSSYYFLLEKSCLWPSFLGHRNRKKSIFMVVVDDPKIVLEIYVDNRPRMAYED